MRVGGVSVGDGEGPASRAADRFSLLFLSFAVVVAFLALAGPVRSAPPPPPPPSPACDYAHCPRGKPGMLNVHLVPHTHDDVGWLKTVDQYYYGARNNIQGAAVQFILDTVVRELRENPDRRFIYVEVAFFYRWWNQQTEAIKAEVKLFVRQGRLEFILGGWSMNDEATTHYSPIIDQHTLGFEFLKRNFGECGLPKIGWQIDPFGHSREQASIFAQFGFDGLFFGRLDYQDKDNREKTKTMEHIWHGSPSNLGSASSLFTGVLPNGYGPPAGFCFSWYCADPPIMDDPSMHDYNVDERVDLFIKESLDQATRFSTNHIINTMGSDFQYFDARIWFKNLDKLIRYVNARQASGSKVNVFYSTPSCYLYALNNANQTWTTKEDDFFPYGSGPHTYWTGYFSSRPAIKRYAFEANAFLQVFKQVYVLAGVGADSTKAKLDALRRSLGVLQHHDAISGTEKQHVADDYAMRLAETIEPAREIVGEAFRKLAETNRLREEQVRTNRVQPQQSRQQPPDAISSRVFCPLLNVSECSATTDATSFVVDVWNPLARVVLEWMRLPVKLAGAETGFVVNTSYGQVPCQLDPISASTKRIPGRSSDATHELVFRAQLPPLGLQSFHVTKTSSSSASAAAMGEPLPPTTKDVVIQNSRLALTFDGATGKLRTIANLGNGQKTNVTFDLLYYKSHPGNNSKEEFRASGAYILRPLGEAAIPVTSRVRNDVIAGPEATEVRQTFADWASLVIRLYSHEDSVEIEWTIGSIPVQDGVGKEVILRYSSSLNSDSTFFTDSNGREILTRKRDFRPTWKLTNLEPVAGNYYPVNSRIFIRDKSSGTQLTVLTDRSQGGASLKDGDVELMLHRRCLFDDAFGVGEALNEPGISGAGLVVRGKHLLFLHPAATAARDHRPRAQQIYMQPSVSFSPMTPPRTSSSSSPPPPRPFSALAAPLPFNVHLLTLEPWGPDGVDVLLRLEHYFEKGEDAVASLPAKVDLANIFADLKLGRFEEMTLGGNKAKASAKRLKWRSKDGREFGGSDGDDVAVDDDDDDGFVVTLKPMQIRTFVAKRGVRGTRSGTSYGSSHDTT